MLGKFISLFIILICKSISVHVHAAASESQSRCRHWPSLLINLIWEVYDTDSPAGEGYMLTFISHMHIKVQVGNDQEKAQSENDHHSKNRGGKKTTN